MCAASVPDSHEICLSVQDINVLFSQTNLNAVRFEVRHVGYGAVGGCVSSEDMGQASSDSHVIGWRSSKYIGPELE